jgi:hypothetical protein
MRVSCPLMESDEAHRLLTSCVSMGNCCVVRVGQNRIYTPYMTVYLVISLSNIPYLRRIYMVLANPMCSASILWSVPFDFLSIG